MRAEREKSKPGKTSRESLSGGGNLIRQFSTRRCWQTFRYKLLKWHLASGGEKALGFIIISVITILILSISLEEKNAGAAKNTLYTSVAKCCVRKRGEFSSTLGARHQSCQVKISVA
jgi:hypothetical protein